MILVNNAGDWSKTFAPLLHAPWHGWTLTDLVFPFFLFIVGAAIPMALAEPGLGAHRKILKRAALLFALGLFLNWFPFYTVHWERARIPGVLQRIAIVYLVAALAYLHLGRRARAALAVLLLAAYWVAMKLGGDLTPEGNLAFGLDHAILGAHTWRYAPGPGDPEGILSTVPAIASALAGIFAGEWLRSHEAPRRKLLGLLAAGAVATLAGLLLDRGFPINKNLWSPSYVVFTAGAALLCLAAAYAWVDLGAGARWAKPFLVFGRNSILAFVGSSLLARLLLVIKVGDVSLGRWLYTRFFQPNLPDDWASLAWALVHVAIWFGVLVWLDRKRIYLKV
jgi:predicted acyltransferase